MSHLNLAAGPSPMDDLPSDLVYLRIMNRFIVRKFYCVDFLVSSASHLIMRDPNQVLNDFR